MAQTNYTPISLYYSTTASAVPTAANLVQGELAINTNDGKLYYEDSSGVVQTLASKAGALGDVVGPASATDNALARFDLTTGKLIQNSVGILSDAGILTGLTGLTSSGSITLSSLTSGRVTFAGASGLLSDSANLTFDGTNLTTGGSETAARFIPSGSTVATNGMFLPAANTLGFSTNSTRQVTISSLGYVGIGVNSPTQTLQLGNAASVEFDCLIAGTRTSTLYTDNSQFIIETATNINMIFNTNATQRMIITGAGNVGIGTSSPATFSVGGSPILVVGNNAQTQITLYGGSNVGDINFATSSSGVGLYSGVVRYDGTSNFMSFWTSSTEKMRLDTSGNLGLGVTPNWGSAVLFPAFQIGVASAFMSGQGSTEGFYAGSNAYYSAGWNYKVNGYATHIRQQDGAHAWFTAPSGTAGNAITFTQAMTLDASNNLALGISSGYRTAASYTALAINGTVGALIDLYASGTRHGGMAATSAGTYVSSTTAIPLIFSTTDIERMRIDSSGNVGIGTTSPVSNAGYSAITVSNTTGGQIFWKDTNTSVTGYAGVDNGIAYLATETNHPLVFRTNNAEKMRLDTSGNLLVGTTSQIGATASRQVIKFDNNNFYGLALGGSASGAAGMLNFYNSAGTEQGYISVNGTGTTTYSTSSDYRLKENIVPMTGALSKVAQLKPVTYKWKESGLDGQGFIAHELAEVVPDCVSREKDGVDADGKPVYQGVDTSFLVATLVSAIQEQQALIESLTTRLTALENK